MEYNHKIFGVVAIEDFDEYSAVFENIFGRPTLGVNEHPKYSSDGNEPATHVAAGISVTPAHLQAIGLSFNHIESLAMGVDVDSTEFFDSQGLKPVVTGFTPE